MFWCLLFVWVHLGPFRYSTKMRQTGEINTKLRAGIFRNECSRSTPLDPMLMFCRVAFRLGASGTVSLLHETWCKTRQTGAINAKVHGTKSCRNLTNICSRSTALDPKLMFWWVSFRLGAVDTVSLLDETCCKTRQTGAINAKLHAMKSYRNFTQRTPLIHTIGPWAHVLVHSFRLGAFGTISLLQDTCCKTRQTGAINTKVRATKSCWNFSQRMLPIHTIRP